MARKILLVDDDRDLVKMLTTLLELEGHQVAALPGGLDSLQATLESEKPDFLLLDLFLGEKNGLDVIREVRREGGMPGLKIIVASGMDLSAESLAAGANAFLLKPYMPAELLELLGR